MCEVNCKTFTEAEFYQSHFDSREYLKTFYRQLDCLDCLPFLLRHLSETFSSGDIRGRRLIEIGCGPTIYGLVSASRHFEELVVSDYTDSNRAEIVKWLNNEEGCFDWRPIIQYICELEGGSRSPQDVELEIRQKVKEVLKCDVRLENFFDPLTIEPADCVLSFFCLESACKDREVYRRALGSIAALLNPDGSLVFIGVINSLFYHVGKQKFSALALSQSFIEETLSEHGFSIKQFHIVRTTESEKERLNYDNEASFFLVAQKTI